MPVKVEKYKSSTGKVFDSFDEAQKDEMLHEEIENLLILIRANEADPRCVFANGGGYKQLTQETVDIFKNGLGAVIRKYLGEELYETYEKCPTGVIGMYLSDYDTPIYGLWTKLICIDSQNRLWGQPYYALNPNKGSQIELPKGGEGNDQR